MQKIHLDTDLGGDIDDLCALDMLLHNRHSQNAIGILGMLIDVYGIINTQ